MSPQVFRCLNCLTENGCELKMTKKMGPYSVCIACGTRTFMRTLDSLRGVGVTPWLLDLAIEQCASNPEFREKFQARIRAVQQSWLARAQGGRAGIAPSPADAESSLPESRNVVPFHLEEKVA